MGDVLSAVSGSFEAWLLAGQINNTASLGASRS